MARAGGCLCRLVCYCDATIPPLKKSVRCQQTEKSGGRTIGTTVLAQGISSETMTSLLASLDLVLLLCPLIIKTSDEIISSGRPVL